MLPDTLVRALIERRGVAVEGASEEIMRVRRWRFPFEHLDISPLLALYRGLSSSYLTCASKRGGGGQVETDFQHT